MILFYRVNGIPGKVCIADARSRDVYLENISKVYPNGIVLLAEIRSRGGAMKAVRDRFRKIEGPTTWYAETAELAGYIAALAETRPTERDRKRRLTDAEAVAVFRAAHAPGNGGYAAVGVAHGGLSAHSVGMVARGVTHAHLFERTPATDHQRSTWRQRWYISERYVGAPKYLLQ